MFGTAPSKKRRAEDDLPEGQKRKEKAPNTFPCTLPSDVWDELKSQVGGLVLSKHGSDFRPNQFENSTVDCVVSLNNAKPVPCRFKIDKSTQCASIQITSTVKGKEFYGVQVYGAQITENAVEWYDNMSDVSQWLKEITKDYVKDRDLMMHLTLKIHTRPVILGYRQGDATDANDPLQQLVENLFSSHTPTQLDVNCRFRPEDQHQGEGIKRAFKDWHDAMYLSSHWGLNWFYRKHDGYQASLGAWVDAKEPELINDEVSFPPHLMTKGRGEQGDRCGYYAVQDIYMDRSHYMDTMGMAVLRESAADSKALLSVYKTGRGAVEATLAPVLAYDPAVNARIPVEGSFVLKIKLRTTSDSKGALPEGGQQLDIKFAGQEGKATRVTTLAQYETGYDVICSATRVDPKLFREGIPVRIDSLEPVFDTKSASNQLKAIRAFETYEQPVDSPLGLEGLLLNHTGGVGTFNMDQQNTPQSQAHLRVAVEYWSTNARLDRFQVQAVSDATSLPGAVLFVHGPPGTGKTQTLTAMLDVAVGAGNTVLFCGPSHASVDEAVRKAVASGKFDNAIMVRMTPPYVEKAQMAGYMAASREHDGVHEDTEAEIERAYLAQYIHIEAAERHPDVSRCRTMAAWKIHLRQEVTSGKITDAVVKTLATDWTRAFQNLFQKGRLNRQARIVAQEIWNQIDDRMTQYVLSQAKVVFVTLNTSSHEDLVASFKPSLLVVDEAAFATEPDVLIPLMAFQKTLKGVVLGGDDRQLGPVVQSSKSSEFARILACSPFTRWQSRNNSRTVHLQKSYRFEQVHCDFLSSTFYEGRLSSALPDGTHSDHVAKYQEVMKHLWPKLKVDVPARIAMEIGDDSKAELFLNSTSLHNQVEAFMVIKFAKLLIWKKVVPGDILIITPYTAQAALISSMISGEYMMEGVRVTTVTQAQSSEAAFVLFSFVRDAVFASPHLTSFAGDGARLCVALSRMKGVMVAFGTWNLYRKMIGKLLMTAATKNFGELVLDFATKSQMLPTPEMLKPPPGSMAARVL